jgi:two-component system cell cycle response regulator
VLTAYSGPEALEILEIERVDVVLLDVMMPAMDGFEVCRRIKASPKTMHVPVVMVTALDQTSDKVQGLEAGADDFLAKPVDDIALITRVKNLARLKTLNDEMLLRMATGAEIGAMPGGIPLWSKAESRRPRAAGRGPGARCQSRALGADQDPRGRHRGRSAGGPDAAGQHGLATSSSSASTWRKPTACALQPGAGDRANAPPARSSSSCSRTRKVRLLRALDMGVNDYLMRPIDRNELLARVRTQIKRKRHSDHLRDRLEESVELALTDQLTGLHNRRYMETHLKALTEQARAAGRPFRCCSPTSTASSRSTTPTGTTPGTTCCASLPLASAAISATSIWHAASAARSSWSSCPTPPSIGPIRWRNVLRACIAGEPFQANGDTRLKVTASVGIATLDGAHDSPQGLLKRADQALYVAKRGGRNRVVSDAA